ncbi:MAG TPA: hypothetical protein VEG34_18445 [Thermoanaerobaculia bacterium]|nr:hypothetical protein [Thermoanaerobaculia bacterium]
MPSKLSLFLAAVLLVGCQAGCQAAAQAPAPAVLTQAPPAAESSSATGITAPALPTGVWPVGVRQVLFGPPFRHQGATGSWYCRIKDPLLAPRFAAGVKEIAWVVNVDPETVKELQGKVTGEAGGELEADLCKAMKTCSTGKCWSQYGEVLRRRDGQPFQAGTYRLEFEVAGQKATVPFEIAAP